jgi:anti-sigma factor RsiW
METDDLVCIDPELGELLPLLEDGLLEVDEHRLLTSHLEACQRCVEDRAAWRALSGAIRGLPPDTLRSHPSRAPVADSGPGRRRRDLVAAAIAAFAIGAIAWSSWRESVLGGRIQVLEHRLARVEVEQRMAQSVPTPRHAASGAGFVFGGATFVKPPNF